MTKKNSDDDIRAEADAYLRNLPDETASGRMVTDSGMDADTAAWEAEEARQQTMLKGKGTPKTDTPKTSMKDKKGNQTR